MSDFNINIIKIISFINILCEGVFKIWTKLSYSGCFIESRLFILLMLESQLGIKFIEMELIIFFIGERTVLSIQAK